MFRAIQIKIDTLITNVWASVLDHRLIAIVRTMLAVAVLMDLVFAPDYVFMDDMRTSRYSLFTIIVYPYGNIFSICMLLWVISGYWPRVSCLFLWWVCFSVTDATFYAHGGNQIATNLSLLLIPVSLSLHKVHHWRKQEASELTTCHFSKKLIAVLGFEMCRLQVMVVYVYNAYAKMMNVYWQRGDTFNYWANDPFIGYPDIMIRLLAPWLQHHWFGMMLTWSVILLEYLFVFAAVFFNEKWNKRMLIIGIIFHFMIILLHGLINFFIIMSAALLILFRPYVKKDVTKVAYN